MSARIGGTSARLVRRRPLRRSRINLTKSAEIQRGELSAKAPYTRLPPPKVDLSLFGKAIQILGHPWSEVLSFVLPRIAEISCFQCSQYCFRFRHGERLPLSRPSGLCCNFGRRRLATCDFDNVKRSDAQAVCSGAR